MTRLLVVTADDFGLSDGVNSAVGQAHRDGIVTSASLLAVGRAYSGAVDLARRLPSLAVGVHLAMVGEDPPLLGATQVRSLVTAGGGFPLSYRTVVRRAALGRLNLAEVRAEFRAQIQRVLDDGIAVTHLDTHQHLHLWPSIGRIVTELARDHGIAAVRSPRSHRRTPLGLGVGVLGAGLARRLDAAALRRTADFAGLDEAGAMDLGLPAALAGLARRGGGSAELNTHPGRAGDPDLTRFAWGYRWEQELAALIDPHSRELVAGHGYRLASWADVSRHGGAR